MSESPLQPPDFDLTGRVALITGAGRGIGLAIAQALASAGCAVAIQDIDEQVAQREAAALEKSGARAIALGGDITDVTIADKLRPPDRETARRPAHPHQQRLHPEHAALDEADD